MAEIDLKLYGRKRFFRRSNKKRVGMLFSGGPAPAANAVISTAAIQLLNSGFEVYGFYNGYLHLQNFDKSNPEETLKEGVHYIKFDYPDITRIRNKGGSILRTARANPAKTDAGEIKSFEDFGDPAKTVLLDKVLDAFEHLEIDGLISIGGDDTLKSAYYLHLLGVPVVHVPKTIDNDYYGIAWTFGYFSAIERARQDLLIYNEETKTTECYFMLELMGRKAGWYTMGAGIAGGATRVVIPEEIDGDLDIDKLAEELTDLIIEREMLGKNYGVILVSEGLADLLPDEVKTQLVSTYDEHGHLRLSELKIGEQLTRVIKEKYKARTGKKLNMKNGIIGYTTRCIDPTAFDVLLASQLGMGAANFVKEQTFGYMVSVGEELHISKIAFSELIDKKTMKTRQRYIDLNSDFYQLGKALQFDAKHYKK